MKVIDRPVPKSRPEIMEFLRELLITASEEEITGITIGLVKGRRRVDVKFAMVENCNIESMIEAAYISRENVLDIIDEIEEEKKQQIEQELDFDK